MIHSLAQMARDWSLQAAQKPCHHLSQSQPPHHRNAQSSRRARHACCGTALFLSTAAPVLGPHACNPPAATEATLNMSLSVRMGTLICCSSFTKCWMVFSMPRTCRPHTYIHAHVALAHLGAAGLVVSPVMKSQPAPTLACSLCMSTSEHSYASVVD